MKTSIILFFSLFLLVSCSQEKEYKAMTKENEIITLTSSKDYKKGDTVEFCSFTGRDYKDMLSIANKSAWVEEVVIIKRK